MWPDGSGERADVLLKDATLLVTGAARAAHRNPA
jgi:hypothetical protein